jgi:hypothetical protein
MSATSLDLSQIKTDALSAASTFRTLIGLGSGNTPTFLGASLTGGTVTASTPLVDATQTWNSAGTVFTGMRLNVTDTASSSSSLLIDLQVGGASRLRVQKNGQIYGNGASPYLYLDQTEGSLLGYGAGNYFNSGGTAYLFVYNNLTEQRFDRNGLRVASGHFLAFSSTTSANSAADAILYRDSAGTLAQRNAGNAQTFRIYESFTDASNYTRGSIAATSSGFDITPEAAGTGSKRPVRILGHSLASAEAVSALEINQTWNTTGTPTLIKANVTDTASSSSSLLMDLQTTVSGTTTSRFSVRKDGRVAIVFPVNGIGILASGNGTAFTCSAFGSDTTGLGAYGLRLQNTNTLTWASTTNGPGNEELTLVRDASHTLGQRNGANAQRFNLYGTFSNSSNYERMFLEYNTTGTAYRIGTEKAGTGSARALELQTDGVTRLTIGTTGLFTIADALNIAVGTTTGTKIGTATTQKLAFFNATPVVQPTAVADATDAASVITQLNALLSRMRTLGLIAT